MFNSYVSLPEGNLRVEHSVECLCGESLSPMVGNGRFDDKFAPATSPSLSAQVQEGEFAANHVEFYLKICFASKSLLSILLYFTFPSHPLVDESFHELSNNIVMPPKAGHAGAQSARNRHVALLTHNPYMEFQDPKVEVLYHTRPYFAWIFPIFNLYT